jgi:DNA repair protein RecN (Recombination protein N)
MLTTLRIKNLALVADLTIEFGKGYNVITGETGAGKSILIGALNLVLGERADHTLIRSGSDNCSVEAVFDVSALKIPLKGFLEENGLEPCEDEQLVLKRAFSAAGTNRQFVNGSPTTLNVLSSLGQWLVDIHGPHEHQSLLHPASQLAILDAFGKLETEREEFGNLLRRRTLLESEKAGLIVDEKTYAQQLDLLRFQVQEITSARLQPDEENQVEEDYRRASNAAKLMQLSQTALALLSENETSVLAHAGLVGRTLQELHRTDGSVAPLLAQHQQVVSALQELHSELSRYAGRLELDPARLQQLEDRLNLLQALKRKYGATLREVQAFGEQARTKLQTLEQRDAELLRLNGELRRIEADLWRFGQALSAQRQKVIPQLSKTVNKQLADLGFVQSRFSVLLSSMTAPAAPPPNAATPPGGNGGTRFTASGLDTVEFQFAPNPGEPARPLRAIASSGELARVMLALKTVLAAQDRIPVLVFDEVDANIGGETAHTVGQKMQQLARTRQVLCITHLPQVAAPADAHLVATKQTRAGRTVSEVRLLESAERVTELARMLGGQTEAARKHAEALLEYQRR